MRGELVIKTIRVSDGKEMSVDRVSNRFLDQGYTNYRAIVGASSAANAIINRMQFGIGTDAPLITDTTLQSPITPIKAVGSFSYDDVAQSMTITAYLLAAEANGFNVAEAALVTVGGTIIARTAFTPRAKTADYLFTFDWTLSTAA